MLLAVKSIGYFHEKAGRCQAIFLVVATVHQTGNDRSSLRYSFANFRARFTRVLCRPLPSRESRFVNKRLTAKEDPGSEDFVRTRARLQRGHPSRKVAHIPHSSYSSSQKQMQIVTLAQVDVHID